MSKGLTISGSCRMSYPSDARYGSDERADILTRKMGRTAENKGVLPDEPFDVVQ